MSVVVTSFERADETAKDAKREERRAKRFGPVRRVQNPHDLIVMSARDPRSKRGVQMTTTRQDWREWLIQALEALDTGKDVEFATKGDLL